MLNIIGGARTCSFLELPNKRCRSDIFSVLCWGGFRVENASNGSGSCIKTIGVSESFSLRYYAYRIQVWFGRYAVFRKACFTPLQYIHTGNSIASAEKTFQRIFYSKNQEKHTKEARRGSITFDVGMAQRLRKCQMLSGRSPPLYKKKVANRYFRAQRSYLWILNESGDRQKFAAPMIWHLLWLSYSHQLTTFPASWRGVQGRQSTRATYINNLA